MAHKNWGLASNWQPIATAPSGMPVAFANADQTVCWMVEKPTGKPKKVKNKVPSGRTDGLGNIEMDEVDVEPAFWAMVELS